MTPYSLRPRPAPDCWPMPYPLTRRQQDALRFIAGHQEAKGYAPSIREIAVGVGNSRTSLRIAHEMLNALEERGTIKRRKRHGKRRARAIKVLVPVAIPRAPDGEPLYFIGLDGWAKGREK